MLPPGFVRYWEGKGVQRPICSECIRFALERGTSRGLCWENGAYVSLYSSCERFERRVGSNAPILDEVQIKSSYKLGLADLTR